MAILYVFLYGFIYSWILYFLILYYNIRLIIRVFIKLFSLSLLSYVLLHAESTHIYTEDGVCE